MQPLEHYDCFISYKAQDRDYAELVVERLEGARFTVWYDRKRLQPGSQWDKEVERYCEASRVVLPILTPRWPSTWTLFESYGADLVIPLVFEGNVSEIIPAPLSRYQGQEIDFSSGAAESNWDKLFVALRQLLAQPAPDKLARTARLKYQPSRNFVGRERELLAIHEHFHRGPTTQRTGGSVFAITALGGVGKTTLARQYAEKFWRCYSQMFWVDARLGLVSELADLHRSLHPEITTAISDFERKDLMLAELNSRERRLLIIDNVEDEQTVQDLLPNSGDCCTLMTSRFANWSSAIASTRIDVLDPEPARELLLKGAGQDDPSNDDIGACDEIAAKLEYLPLALEQAAAYVRQQRRGFRHYLKVYEEAATDLLRKGVLGSTQYPDSVLTTWNSTIAKLPVESRALLNIAAFMAPAPIPVPFIIAGADILRNAVKALKAAEGEPATTLPDSDEFFVGEAIGPLADYSMIRQARDSVSVHSLVQIAAKVGFDTGQFAFWSLRAVDFIEVLELLPASHADFWPELRTLNWHMSLAMHHAAIAHEKIGQCDVALPTVTVARAAMVVEPSWRLLDRIVRIWTYFGHFFIEKGQRNEAEHALRNAASVDSNLPSDPSRSVRYVRLQADMLRDTDQREEAEQLLREELKLHEADLGPEHPDIAIPLNRLADLFIDNHRWTEAEQLLQRAEALLKGHATPRLLAVQVRCAKSLLRLYLDSERHDLANEVAVRIANLERGITDEPGAHTVVGSEHLREADEARAAGNTERAISLLRAFLEGNEQTFGADSARFSLACSQAANALAQLDRLDQAIELIDRALVIRQRVYGKEHTACGDLWEQASALYEGKGLYKEALTLNGYALMIKSRAYPMGHRQVANSMRRSGRLCGRTGDLNMAEKMLTAALMMKKRVYGQQHREVAGCMLELADVLERAGKSEDAVPLREGAWKIKRGHGLPGHPHTRERTD